MTRWLFNIGWALLALLGIAAFIISSGKMEGRTNPSTTSYFPSGASALASLLQANGYQVRVDRSSRPKLTKGDVAIAFDVNYSAADSEQPKEASDDTKSDKEPGTDPPNFEGVASFIDGQQKAGVVVIWAELVKDIEAVSDSADKPTAFTRVDGKVRNLSASSIPEPNQDQAAVKLAETDSSTLVTATKSGAGYEIDYADGIGLVNRYLDKADNAQFFLETLRAYAPGPRTIVFTEGTFDEQEKAGFLETLGPWAEGAWYQLLFLLAIVIITLNRRFGLPRTLRKRQTGTRELVDALTDTMIRAKATTLTLDGAATQTDLKLRSLLKLPRDASDGERDRILPPRLASALHNVKAAAGMKKPPPGEAYKLIVTLEREYAEFSSMKRGDAAPRIRRKNLL